MRQKVRVRQGRGGRGGKEVRGCMGVGGRGETGGMGGGGMEGVQVRVEVCGHMIGGDCCSAGDRVFGVRSDQRWVPVDSEGFVLIDDEWALGAAAG